MLFGLHSATLACQRTTKAVSYILNEEGILVDIYIDDFYGAETQELADLSFDHDTVVLGARLAIIARQRHTANT